MRFSGIRRLSWIAPLALVAACGGGGDGGGSAAAGTASAADLAEGQKLYRATCAMCHGYQGEGVERLGKPLVGSEFVRSRTDEELIAFLIEGRAADHPDNTQGVPMPPRGGNPNLSDEDLGLILVYMRSIS